MLVKKLASRLHEWPAASGKHMAATQSVAESSRYACSNLHRPCTYWEAARWLLHCQGLAIRPQLVAFQEVQRSCVLQPEITTIRCARCTLHEFDSHFQAVRFGYQSGYVVMLTGQTSQAGRMSHISRTLYACYAGGSSFMRRQPSNWPVKMQQGTQTDTPMPAASQLWNLYVREYLQQARAPASTFQPCLRIARLPHRMPNSAADIPMGQLSGFCRW